MEYTEKNSELVAQENNSLITIQEIIKAFFLDEELSKEQTDFLEANVENIQKFLDAPINSPQDAETKKIFAKVILHAKQRGILPESIDKVFPTPKPNETEEEKDERIEDTAEIISETVDDGLDKGKTNYKVGIGEMAAEKAFEYFVDKATVRVAKVADKLVDKGFDWVINKGPVLIETRFPKLIPVVEVVKHVLTVAKPVVRKAVQKGVQVLGRVVKAAGKTVVSVAKKTFSAVKSSVSKVASWVKSWF